MSTRLTTDRISLRPLTHADADDLLALHSDPEVMRFLSAGPPPARQVIEDEIVPLMTRYYPCLDGPAYLAAEERTSGAFLGWFELRPSEPGDASVVELGYRLNRSCWGRGLATEGADALLRTAFSTHNAQRVYAETMAVNSRSRRVLEKAGLQHVQTFFQHWPRPLPGSEHGEVRYALSREAWQRACSERGSVPAEPPAPSNAREGLNPSGFQHDQLEWTVSGGSG